MFSIQFVLIDCLSLLCRKPFTIQITICLGESGGWCRGNSYFLNSCFSTLIWMFICKQNNADNFLSAPLSFFVCWCNCIFPGNSHVKCLVWGVVSFALDGYVIIITGQFITSSQNVHWWSSAKSIRRWVLRFFGTCQYIPCNLPGNIFFTSNNQNTFDTNNSNWKHL